MRQLTLLFFGLLVLSITTLDSQIKLSTKKNKLSVYPPVPGLAPSPHYRFKVKKIDENDWLNSYAWLTKCPDTNALGGHYNKALGGWTHTYCNFEMTEHTEVMIEITRLDPATGQPVEIEKATPHPRRKVKDWSIIHGKVYITIDQPGLFAVDIDGQMDDQMTPKLTQNGKFPFTGKNAIHTLSIFANPFLQNKPKLGDPGVFIVEPGKQAPDDGNWHTLYFKPGVHRLFKGQGTQTPGDVFKLRDNKKYYIPGDAIVYGNMVNLGKKEGENIHLFGHGTLSGAYTPHPAFGPIAKNSGEEKYYWNAKLYSIKGGQNCSVEGITFADPANHTCNVGNHPNNFVRWTKAFTWRANGDGMSASGGTLEHCFLRTQDDGTYFTMGTYRNNVYWSDANGRSLRASHMLNKKDPNPVLLENIDIIYARTKFKGGWVLGGKGFLKPKENNNGSHITFRNINFEDPMPAKGFISFDTSTKSKDSGILRGVRFENIRAVSDSIWGAKNTLLARDNFKIDGFIFDNFTMAGKQITSLNEFDHNEFVQDIKFQNTHREDIYFNNHSGYKKWYKREDWSTKYEPSDHDHVYHTRHPGELIVDCPAYAGNLVIGHEKRAAILIRNEGILKISNQLVIGADNKIGNLLLHNGTLRIENRASNAIDIKSGSITIADGTLLWSGNQISTIEHLLKNNLLHIKPGKKDMLTKSATLLGNTDNHHLYADYNNLNPGITTIWVYSKYE